ncbi:MAG: triose-phosphate isomerase [bacterium]|nr:triose-phosphate isomerase [bacterium]
MKKIVVANWKCFKTTEESVTWVTEVGSKVRELSDIDIVVCPSFAALDAVSRLIEEKGYALKVCSQTVSSYEQGAYTGEVSAKMLSGLVSYSLVGHSERRSNFAESNEDIEKKFALSKQYTIEPLLLIRDDQDTIPEGATYFAWEPVNAIGTGTAIDAQTADDMVVHLAKGRQGLYGMYGGSVTPENINTYMQSPHLFGVVVGSASLDPSKFLEMLNAIR